MEASSCGKDLAEKQKVSNQAETRKRDLKTRRQPHASR
jgi:hypothetical protein